MSKGKEKISPFAGSKFWMDGEFVGYEDAKVSVNSHSLHYGLGAFEGIRCYETKSGKPAIFRLDEHIDRIYNSCHILQIPIPYEKKRLKAQ
jgi:branched chain amino acid aminotransferase apoenzyme (EC 2.6.1.42)